MKIAIVGAGVAGLSTAARLASQNITVDIYEANNHVGGKMYQYTNADGLSWDTGPTLISLPEELERTFSEINAECPVFLELKDNCHLYFSDGTDLLIPSNKDDLLKIFETSNKKW